MRKGVLLLASALPQLAFALGQEPWYGEYLEIHFVPSYEYNFFNRINQASPQLKKNYNTHIARALFDVTVPAELNWQVELEYGATSSVSFGYRSVACQLRRLWLDDVCGDPISLSTGISYRDASSRMRKAFSTPYHGRCNFEAHLSLGKEWSRGPHWFFRASGIFAVGQATIGKPWLRGDLLFLGNCSDRHYFTLYEYSYFGLGQQTEVDTKNFTGWGHIAHRSIDLGASYVYAFDLWGNLRFDYRYRVFAKSYPEGVNTFLVTYTLPFSLF